MPKRTSLSSRTRFDLKMTNLDAPVYLAGRSPRAEGPRRLADSSRRGGSGRRTVLALGHRGAGAARRAPQARSTRA